MVRIARVTGGADHPDDQLDGLTCTYQCINGTVRLSLSGDMGLANLSLFRARVKTAAETAGRLVLDLSTLRYIDSTGIHALLDAYQIFSSTGRCMALVSVPPNVQRVLRAFGADEILPVFSTVEAALESFRDGQCRNHIPLENGR